MNIWRVLGDFTSVADEHRRSKDRKLRVVGVSLFISAALSILVLALMLKRPALSSEEQALLERYKAFYLNSESPNKTTMIEFTNSELKKRATTLYTGIKAMNEHYSELARARNQRKDRKEIDQAESGRLWQEEMAANGKEFDEKYRVDARMVLLELRQRIPAAARKHIIGLPNINPADKRAGQVSMYDIFPSDVAVGFSDHLARELEELCKLLPDHND